MRLCGFGCTNLRGVGAMSEIQDGHDGLDRRRFLGTIAAGSVAAVGSSGCTSGALHRLTDHIVTEELASFVERLDAALGTVDARLFVREIATAFFDSESIDFSSSELADQFAHTERVERRILRALLVAGMVHDLPVEVRTSEEMRRYLSGFEAELDVTMADTCRLVASLPNEVRDGLREMQRDDPELFMRLSEVLDENATAFGMGRSGRAKLRHTFAHITGRLRRQPPSLLIDECLDTMERSVAQQGFDVDLWRCLTTAPRGHALWEPFASGSAHAKSPEEALENAESEGEHVTDSTPENTDNDAHRMESDTDSEDERSLLRRDRITTLIQMLSDADPDQRMNAAHELGTLDAIDAVPALIRVFRLDTNQEVREWTLRSLFQIDAPGARWIVSEARRDRNGRIRHLAQQFSGSSASHTAANQSADHRTDSASESGEGVDDTRTRRYEAASRSHVAIAGSAISVGAFLALGGVSGTVAGAYVLTVGAILCGIGLIVALVGLILRLAARARRRRRSS